MNNFGLPPIKSSHEGSLGSFLLGASNKSIIKDEFSDFFNEGSLNSMPVTLGAPKKNHNQAKYNDVFERSPLNGRSPLYNIDNIYERSLSNNKSIGMFGCEKEMGISFNPFKEINNSTISSKSRDLPLFQAPKKAESLINVSLKRKFEDLDLDEYHSPNSDEAYSSDLDFPLVKKHKPVPMTPSKKVRIREDSFAAKALKIQATNDQVLCLGDSLINFKLNPDLNSKKSGDFVQVSEILFGQPQLYPNIKNDKILHKCYKKDVIESRPGMLEKYRENSIKQHDELLKAKFPISKILNNPLIDGFFLVKKIEHEFSITWNKKTPIDCLDVRSKWLLHQVKIMFQYAYENKILLDLSRNNVRYEIDDNDIETVFLIDFKEELESNDEYYLFIEPNISTFANGNEEVANYLRPIGYNVDTPSLNKNMWV